ncbi:MAG: acyltransferase [Syntrophales bacterium]
MAAHFADHVTWRFYKRLFKLTARHVPGFRVRRMFLKMAGYRIGKAVYIGEDLIIKDELDDRGMVIIGDRVSIAERVTLVTSSKANFSQYRAIMGELHSPIEIMDDAWLGTGCIVLPGVKIGRGAVVGAASLVTSDVPEFTVVAGIPAKQLRKIEIPESRLASNPGRIVP